MYPQITLQAITDWPTAKADITLVHELATWHKLTLLNGYTGPAYWRVSGGLLELAGYVNAPAGASAEATDLFAAPVVILQHQYNMNSIPQGNVGSNAPFADLFADTNGNVKIWHAVASKSFSLAGVSFITKAAADAAK